MLTRIVSFLYGGLLIGWPLLRQIVVVITVGSVGAIAVVFLIEQISIHPLAITVMALLLAGLVLSVLAFQRRKRTWRL